MSVLRVFNVSDYIHAGAAPRSGGFSAMPYYYGGVRELPDGSYAASKLPTGGLSFMLNPVFESIVKKDPSEILVFCVDDVPTIKRNIYKEVLHDAFGYKGNRAKKSVDLSIQRKAAKDLLSTFSSNILFKEGYEADDLIAGVVRHYKNHVDHIYIHTVDKDLYSLIDTNVSVEPVGTRGNSVSKDNFTKYVVDYHKNPMPFNCIYLDKLIYGDKSDNIPGIGSEWYPIIQKVITPDFYPYLTDHVKFKSWVKKATNNHQGVMGIVKLLIPLDVDQESVELSEEPIDFNSLLYAGKATGCKYAKRLDDVMTMQHVKDVLDYYTDMYYMEGGRFNG